MLRQLSLIQVFHCSPFNATLHHWVLLCRPPPAEQMFNTASLVLPLCCCCCCCSSTSHTDVQLEMLTFEGDITASGSTGDTRLAHSLRPSLQLNLPPTTTAEPNSVCLSLTAVTSSHTQADSAAVTRSVGPSYFRVNHAAFIASAALLTPDQPARSPR